MATASVLPIRRRLQQEKRLERMSLRCSDTIKDLVEARATARGRTISEHMMSLLILDLERQRLSGRTLEDAVTDLARALELARTGIDTDDQRKYLLIRMARLAVKLLEGWIA